MTIQTLAPANDSRGDNNSYDAGYFDGELDAISKLPAALANNRASMADPYDPIWAQGYADGYLNQIQVTYALAEPGGQALGD
ncbi:hypothetical protein [Streptomyces scabiei]|uniref:hypothetical protein n=1 Tax=Streptomyces scabiei TaxID=1930 RepID=UPI0007658ADB|nr:hypothetical protein [Streptomyces scabiei]MDX3000007.1 hypothetical protein [Streptomyces scabiei]MDX3053510.1 hypothetical protein [Streptomyces scabiei]